MCVCSQSLRLCERPKPQPGIPWTNDYWFNCYWWIADNHCLDVLVHNAPCLIVSTNSNKPNKNITAQSFNTHTHTHTHTHKENTATYADGSPDTDFGQAQKGGGIKPINGIPILPFLITEISSCNLLWYIIRITSFDCIYKTITNLQ